jgi:hypothetical protein
MNDFLVAQGIIDNCGISLNTEEAEYVIKTCEAFNKSKPKGMANLVKSINENATFFVERLMYMNKLGLSFANSDYYIYPQNYNLTVSTTPKGTMLVIGRLAMKRGLIIVPQTYQIKKSEIENVEFPTVNGFDTITIKRDNQSTKELLLGKSAFKGDNGVVNKNDFYASIVALIANVKIMTLKGVTIASSNIIIPQDEYEQIIELATKGNGKFSTNYFETFIDKTLYKRILKWLLTVLGDETGELSQLENDMRLDDESSSISNASHNKAPSQEELEAIAKEEADKAENERISKLKETTELVLGTDSPKVTLRFLLKKKLKIKSLKDATLDQLTYVANMIIHANKVKAEKAKKAT